MMTKINCWWHTHIEKIANISTIIAILELILIALLIANIVRNVQLLHDIEVLLTAHGVEWALYTMP